MRPSLITISTCDSAVMSNSGLPFTTMMSAIFPGSIDPSSRPFPDDFRVAARRRGDRAHRGHAHVDVDLDFAPQRLAVEIHRRARVGAHPDDRTGLDELLHAALAEQHFAIGPLKIAEGPPVLERVLHLGIDV